MIKVAIADDENIVKLGLRSLIDWEANGFEITGLFNNGKEVLDYYAARRLDILITDIKMPIINGIELIMKIKNLLPAIRVIVLSNYDEFQLVTQAFKAGASDYLLKQNIEPESLLKLLNTIKLDIERKGNLNDVNDLEDYSQNRIKEDFLSNMLYGNETQYNDINSGASEIIPSIKPPNIYCALIRLYKSGNGSKVMYKGHNPHIRNVRNLITDVMNRYCGAESIEIENHQIALIISSACGSGSEITSGMFGEISDDICESLNNYFGLKAYIGLSLPKADFTELHISYIEALKALNVSFFKPNETLFRYDSQNSSGDGFQLFLDAYKKDIHSCIYFNDIRMLRSVIEDLFDRLSIYEFADPAPVRQFFIYYIEQINIYLYQNYNTNIETLYDGLNPLQAILASADLISLRVLIMESVNGLEKSMEINKSFNNIVAKAKEYINKNYMNNIGLFEVSEYLGIHYGYLSKIFKDKTGENFLSYLSRIRIEKAIEMINKGEMTTEEIARNVSYSNTNYFTKIFKKITGKTLSEYKMKL